MDSKPHGAETGTQKPDFIADPYGQVQDVRRLDEAQVADALSTWKVRCSPRRPEPQYHVIYIPIGLFVSLIVLLASLASPDGRAKRSFNAGNDDYDARRYDQAIARYDQAIRLKPGFGEAYNNRGLAHRAAGHYDRAIADFDQAVRLMSLSSEVYNNRGLAYRAIGAYDKAIADFSQAIEHDLFHTNEAYYDNRGVAYWYKDDHDRAIADFDAGIRAVAGDRVGLAPDPQPGEADTVDQGVDERLTAFQFEDDLPLLYAHRGLAYLSKGDLGQALADLNRSIKLRPTLALAYYLRGLAYRTAGDYERAVGDFRQVITLGNDPAMQSEAESQLRELGVNPANEMS
jgi:tetratricopeptide (TPR) repeat protein